MHTPPLKRGRAIARRGNEQNENESSGIILVTQYGNMVINHYLAVPPFLSFLPYQSFLHFTERLNGRWSTSPTYAPLPYAALGRHPRLRRELLGL